MNLRSILPPVLNLLALTLLPTLLGCSSRPAPAPPSPITPDSSRAIPIFRGSDGSTVAYTDLLAAALNAEVIIIGENHAHRIGNAWAATLFEDVIEKAKSAGRPTKPALSMEFFERDDQSRLDDYLKGVVDEATFRKTTSRAEGNYPPGHARMVEAAKKHAVPVIAANMPWQFVRFIRGKDYAVLDALTPEQTRLFRIPDAMVEGRYRTDHDELMGPMVDEELNAKKPASHGTAAANKHVPANARPFTDEERAKMVEENAAKKKARLDALFRVMQLWDWTMAESVARAFTLGPNDDIQLHDPSQAVAEGPIIHIIGRFHCDFTGGMPQALKTLRPGTKMIIISVVDQSSATLNDDDKGRGDFVVYVGEEEANGSGQRDRRQSR